MLEYCCGTMNYCLNKQFIHEDGNWVVIRFRDHSKGEKIAYEDLSIQYCPFCGKEPEKYLQITNV